MTFDTTPKPALLRAMQNQSWTVHGALAELIDNSFGPGRGDAGRVIITHDSAARTIRVLDNGRGMDGIGQLFRLGDGIGRQPKDIGEYGSGGTMALLWLNKSVEVYTLRGGMVNFDRVNWARVFKQDTFPMVSDGWKKATVANTPSDLLDVEHGTLIVCHLLKERTFYPSPVKRDLAQIYAPATRAGKELIWRSTQKRGGATDQFMHDPIAAIDKDRRVDFEITVDVGRSRDPLYAIGQIGIIDNLPVNRSVVHIGFGPRVIMRTKECYRSPDGSRQYSGVGVTGYLDLEDGWQPYLSTTKDGVNDGRVWTALMGHIFTKIEPLLVEVERAKLYVELDGIGEALEGLLDGNAVVTVRLSPGDGPDRIPGDGPIAKGAGPYKPTKPVAKDDEGDIEAERPAVTGVKLEPSSDAEMGRLLCRAERRGDNVLVYINADHPYMEESMKARPVNRMALNGVITREIAAVVLDDTSLFGSAFKPSVRKIIIDSSNPEAMAHRILLDRCHSSVPDEDAA